MGIRIGIVGAGAIGNVHIGAAKEAGIPIAAVADIDEKLAKETAQKNGIPRALSSADELFASKDIDAVIIGVPNKFHAPLTIAALQAGKDVMVEKPMALNVAECKAMNAAATKHKRILQVGFVSRYSAAATKARDMVCRGRLGKVYHAQANYYRRRGVPGLGGWFTTKAMSGGGPLIDLGPHLIDLSLFVMNFPKPVRVSGKVYANFGCRMKNYVFESMWAGPPRLDGVCDVEDAAHALIRFEDGATLEVNTTWAGNFPDDAMPNNMVFMGDKAGLSFQLGGETLKMATEDDGCNVDVTPKLAPVSRCAEQIKAFVHSVETRSTPRATGEQGQTVQSLLDAIYESSQKDREVEL